MPTRGTRTRIGAYDSRLVGRSVVWRFGRNLDDGSQVLVASDVTRRSRQPFFADDPPMNDRGSPRNEPDLRARRDAVVTPRSVFRGERRRLHLVLNPAADVILNPIDQRHVRTTRDKAHPEILLQQEPPSLLARVLSELDLEVGPGTVHRFAAEHPGCNGDRCGVATSQLGPDSPRKTGRPLNEDEVLDQLHEFRFDRTLSNRNLSSSGCASCRWTKDEHVRAHLLRQEADERPHVSRVEGTPRRRIDRPFEPKRSSLAVELDLDVEVAGLVAAFENAPTTAGPRSYGHRELGKRPAFWVHRRKKPFDRRARSSGPDVEPASRAERSKVDGSVDLDLFDVLAGD